MPLTVLDGSSFFVTEPDGNVVASAADGFFHEDVRHLSRWRLRIDGHAPLLVGSRPVDYYSARIDLIETGPNGTDAPPLRIRRDRFVAGGMHEDIEVTNLGHTRRGVRVQLEFGADFADLQAIQRGTRGFTRSGAAVETGGGVTCTRDGPGRARATTIRFSRAGHVTATRAVFDLNLEPGESWSTCVDVSVRVGDDTCEPLLRCGQFGRPLHDMPMGFDEWMTRAAQVHSDSPVIRRAVEQGLADLAALRVRPTAGLPWSVPAGGMPWFMTLFGRDTIWAAYQSLPFHSELAQTALLSLAALQADADDPYRDAEPGKILHELRRGPLAETGELPHRPYYGSHDATPLYVMLLNEYHLWTADSDLVRKLEPNLRAALTWIERYGDLDGDGFLEYLRRSSKGLRNQCWKDSDSSIRFADGTLAEGSIATCELQAYAYRARLDAARLMRNVLADDAYADTLERDGNELKQRFDAAYWSDARRQYVLALDGRKRQVDAMTSNVGHLLFCGIVPPERAEQVGDRLMASDMFSGWGVRTMSALDGAYNPLEYHNGTVWPFDTAIAAEGLRRYGRGDDAATLALALLDAAERFDHRLPEVFSGLARDGADVPTAYPDANSPQAFSAGAPLLLVRTLLGLDVIDGALVSRPIHTSRVGHLELLGVWAAGRHQNVPEHLDPAAVGG